MKDPEARLEDFLARYLPAVAAQGRAAIRLLRQRLPGCDALVYDNYQALAVGFSPDGTTGAAIVSVALYPRWVNLFFLHGSALPDPAGLLKGDGTAVRRMRLKAADDVQLPPVRALIEAALAQSPVPYDPARAGRLVIKSVSEQRKPRRPG